MDKRVWALLINAAIWALTAGLFYRLDQFVTAGLYGAFSVFLAICFIGAATSSKRELEHDHSHEVPDGLMDAVMEHMRAGIQERLLTLCCIHRSGSIDPVDCAQVMFREQLCDDEMSYEDCIEHCKEYIPQLIENKEVIDGKLVDALVPIVEGFHGEFLSDKEQRLIADQQTEAVKEGTFTS